MYGNLTPVGTGFCGKQRNLTVKREEMRIFNPTHEQIFRRGSSLVRQTDQACPAPAGKRYVDTYADGDGELSQSWCWRDWLTLISIQPGVVY